MAVIGLAVLGATALGCADYAGGVATGRLGVRRVLIISEPVAALALLAALPRFPGALTGSAAGWGIAAGLAAAAGQALLYTTLARGSAGVAAPLSGVMSVAVPVAWAALTGRPATAREALGFALLVGAVVASCGRVHLRPAAEGLPAAAGVAAGVAAGAGFGAYSVLLSNTPAGSSVWPVIVAHAAVAATAAVWGLGGVAVGAVAGAMGLGGLRDPRPERVHRQPRTSPQRNRRFVDPERRAQLVGVLAGLAESAAAAAILAAARRDVAVTGAMAAIHPVVTVLLSRFIGGTDLKLRQVAGILLSCVGVVTLAG